jgi:two-component system, chemotaxis family, protein-glutamate methylesterase/glutaminase
LASVMVVDDSIMMRSMLSMIVGADPAFDVVERAGNGCEALEKLRAKDCDIVLLDLEMPRMNGLEALRRLRLFSKAKVIVVSSSVGAGSPTAIAARREGAVAVIPKPSGSVSMDLKTCKGHEILRACRRAVGLPGNA